MKDNGSVCKMTIDGTDFQINEPTPFDKKWYSHKFKSAGLRYEVGVCIQTGWICWTNGPYPCGEWSDLRISRDALIYHLEPGEKVVADGGYGGAYHDKPDKRRQGSSREKMKAAARARHETVNARLKEFSCLSSKWRHSIGKHMLAFEAVANLVQIKIEKEGIVFPVYYDDKIVA
jgi:hypothetical protein